MLRGCRLLLNLYAQRCYSDACTVNNWRPWQAPSNRVSKKTVHYPFTWVLSHRRWGVRHVEKTSRHPWRMDDETKRFGRVAAQLLRHKAQKLGLDIRPDGYVRVRDVLDTPSFRNMHRETFIQMTKNNIVYLQLVYETDGVDSEEKIPWVRARAGHTIPGVNSGLRRILRDHSLPTAVYCTSLDSWEWICMYGIPCSADGLIRLWVETKMDNLGGCQPSSRMSEGRGRGPDGAGVVPEVFISVEISIHKAVSSGIKLYLNKKGDRIFSKGDRNGVLPPVLFTTANKVTTEKEVLIKE